MRITRPQQVKFVQGSDHSMIFRGSAGEHLQVSVLDHDLIRVQHWPDGKMRLDRTWLVVDSSGDTPHEGRRRDDLSPFPRPRFERSLDSPLISLKTEQLHVEIQPDDFAITWSDKDGRIFAADLGKRAYSYDLADGSVYHYLRRHEEEHYYGFGEKTGPLNKAGRRMRMLNVDALGYNAETSDPLYKHWPFYITWVPSLNIGYGLFYDNLATTVFDLGSEIDAFWGSYRYMQAMGGDLDYYLIYGPTVAEVIEKFTRLTGRPALPPRWTLGYLGSTMAYTEASNAQEQLRQFVDDCKKHDIPCDMFHLSSGYTTDSRGVRYVFTWNHSRVPDPKAMTAHFHEAGIRLAANIKPHLLTNHPNFEDLAEKGALIQATDGTSPAITTFWSGGMGESGDGGYIDFTSAAGYDWWKERVKTQLFDYGIDAAWNDNNEFEIWDDAARCAGFGQPIPLGLLRPLQTLLMARASYEAAQEQHPNQRPFVLTRAGAPGIQRYAQTWTGDNYTSWHTLQWNTPMGLGLSLSGMPNIGHDIGGFAGPAPDPELLVRWVQSGIFHPRFTLHSWKADGSVTVPWMYPEVLPQIRELIQFRYRLIPYLYMLLFAAHQTGAPIIRPLVYHFADDPYCWNESFTFMVGASLLVAPVTQPGVTRWSVYLPARTTWCDWHTGNQYEGGQTVTVDAPLERVPLFIRAGGIVPLAGSEDANHREIFVFPHPNGGESTFTLIEDDGLSLDYQRGGVTRVEINISGTGDTLKVQCRAEGGYPLPYREMTVKVFSGKGEMKTRVVAVD
ncbi:MAG: glycoside hydrolase family 31 protein [bacterium]|nr:glycoside hydrolase family 31 protein [bacterium]